MKYFVIVFFNCVGFASAQNIPSADVQIKVALMAAPEESKAKAMVYGYSPKGDFIVLQKVTMNSSAWLTIQPQLASTYRVITKVSNLLWRVGAN